MKTRKPKNGIKPTLKTYQINHKKIKKKDNTKNIIKTKYKSHKKRYLR